MGRTLSRSGLLALFALSLACDAHGVPSAAASSAPSGDPVLVELFTSEGCSSCPPADERLSAIARAGLSGVPVVVLGMHVDYWDELGWKDTFGSPAWSDRQRAYSRSLGRGNVYTPEAVVDGAADFVGSDTDAAAEQVRRASQRPKAMLALGRGAVAGSGELVLTARVSRLPPVTPGDSVEVMVALAEENLVDPVARGENAGKRLALAPVTLSLDAMGTATEGATVTRTLTLPRASGSRALDVVVFAQERRSRKVLGVTSAPLSRL